MDFLLIVSILACLITIGESNPAALLDTIFDHIKQGASTSNQPAPNFSTIRDELRRNGQVFAGLNMAPALARHCDSRPPIAGQLLMCQFISIFVRPYLLHSATAVDNRLEDYLTNLFNIVWANKEKHHRDVCRLVKDDARSKSITYEMVEPYCANTIGNPIYNNGPALTRPAISTIACVFATFNSVIIYDDADE